MLARRWLGFLKVPEGGRVGQRWEKEEKKEAVLKVAPETLSFSFRARNLGKLFMMSRELQAVGRRPQIASILASPTRRFALLTENVTLNHPGCFSLW